MLTDVEAKVCEECEQVFDRPRSRHGYAAESSAQWDARRFCSRKCANAKRARLTRRGSRYIDRHGYVRVTLFPGQPFFDMATVKDRKYGYRYVLEHRLVMAQHLGRWLAATETVHHINGDKTDNRIENLQLRRGKHGTGNALRCRSCGSHDIESVEI